MAKIDFNQVEDLFILCLEQPIEKRLTYLEENCGEKDAVYSEVKSLLAAHARSNTFLSRPVQLHTVNSQQKDKLCRKRQMEYLGKTIGVYQLDDILGHGGMGCVYLAHRIDGEYEQDVAIKIVESSTLETQLFKRERQILAQLNHPNIVNLLDGGTLHNHSNYFIMEYVNGVGIDEYVLNKSLNTQQTIELIIKLGLVIQEAHRHGIIHCDIKPANILVTNDGILKLLDFGIAQHLNNSIDSEQEEGTSRFALTPEYSSPRRHQQYTPVIGDDIFSLGILLSHALSGHVPDTRISAHTQFPEPNIKKISQQIQQYELRQIFLKATHTEDKERYASAKSFVDDLQNYLDHRPVNAVNNRGFYVLKKHIGRNYQYWSMALIIVVILIVSSSLWLNKAQVESESKQIQTITEDMIDDLDTTLEGLPQTTVIRKKLIEIANYRIAKLSQQASENIVIKTMHARTLSRLGEVTGHPYALNQGDVKGALKYYREALHIYKSLLNKREDPIIAEIDVANMQRKLAEIKAYEGYLSTALQTMAGIRLHLDEVFQDIPLEQQLPRMIFYIVEAHGYFHTDYLNSAEVLLNKAWEIVNLNKELDPKYNLELAFLHEETGHLAFLKGQYETAKTLYGDVLNKYQNNNLWQHKRRIARVHNGLGCIALLDENTVVAQIHFEARWKAYKKLSKKYPKVGYLRDKAAALKEINKQLANEAQPSQETLNAALSCKNPLSFMIPPIQEHP
jgi:serine/threonine protein kinase